jgi:hypothetical protein
VGSVSKDAIHCVGRLKRAPGGERISAAERAILYFLATQHHRVRGARLVSLEEIATHVDLSKIETARITHNLASIGLVRNSAEWFREEPSPSVFLDPNLWWGLSRRGAIAARRAI